MKNIQIAYLLTICKYSWFWLGIWIFYYLRFTNYAGIGLIEMSLIIAMVISEIPTGAVADLLGKRKTLFISFLLQGFGGFMMAFAPHVNTLIIAVFIMGIGGSFYSGTLEALVYDSLKEKDKTHDYDKVISRITSISLVTPALCSILGGYLYTIQPSIPFLFNAIFYSFGILLSLLLTEPKIDTIKFSFKNFIEQTKVGVRELQKNKFIFNQTILLLSIGVIIVICDEMLNHFLSIEFGFNPEQLGILWSVIYLISAIASQTTPFLKRYMSYKTAAILIGISLGVSLLVSPLLGILFGGLSLILRTSLQAMYGNITSILLNENTQSQYRATTISTFNLFKNIPYVLTAFMLGYWSDLISAVNVAFILGSILVFLVGLQLFSYKINLQSSK